MHFQEARNNQFRIEELEEELDKMSTNLETLGEEKIRLMREIAQIKASRGFAAQDVETDFAYLADHAPTEGRLNDEHLKLHHMGIPQFSVYRNTNNPKTAKEVAMTSIGNLRVYEMMLGLCFITIILNWILMP